MKPGQLTIISAGQTGAHQAALDWAIGRSLPHDGHCPQGRLAEDGPIPDRFRLMETATSDPAAAAELNIVHSDATVILSVSPKLEGGSLRTAEIARQHGRPCLHLHSDMADAPRHLAKFLRHHEIRRLNVAGPRLSRAPGICEFVSRVLEEAWTAFASKR